MTIAEPTVVKRFSVQLLLILGITASILVGVGEWMLHYLPEGPGGEVAMLEKVPLIRASRGHFISIYAAPLYFAGYYGLMRIFSDTSYWLSRVLLVVGIYAFALGGMWISSRYFGAEVLQRSFGSDDFKFYMRSFLVHDQSIVWALRICIVIISLVYVYLILKNKMGLPKWMALLNPAVLLAIIISSLIWAKPLGVHLAPAAMNVAHFIFFGVLLIQYRRVSISNL